MTDQEWTDIRIAGPLPMSVAGALMTTIGTMWPEAVIVDNARDALHMRVPKAAAKSVDEEFIEQIQKDNEVDPEYDGEFLGFRDGWVAFAPPEELCLYLGSIAHSIMKGYPKEIANHLEWTVLTGKGPDDPSYVLSISRSKEQTPMAMHKKAEKELAHLRECIEDFINTIETPGQAIDIAVADFRHNLREGGQ